MAAIQVIAVHQPKQRPVQIPVFARAWAAITKRLEVMMATRRLLEQNDHMLNDIGLRRTELERQGYVLPSMQAEPMRYLEIDRLYRFPSASRARIGD